MPSCAECKASTRWTEKTKLEKILIVSIILTSALVLAVLCAYLVAILAKKEKDKEKEAKSSKDDIDNVCLTESCVFSAATILENMDPKVAPCEDFYKFACGNFVKKTIVPEDQTGADTISKVKESLQEKLKLMLEAPIQTNELKPFKMIKKIYKTCMNVDLIEKDEVNTIRSILKDLGGWPVVEGDKWAESRFDWKELTYKFRKIGYSDQSLFLVYVDRHPEYSDRRVLYIYSSPRDRKERLHIRVWTDEDVSKAYFRYMVDTAVLFGVDRNRSESELREAFIFDKKILDLANKTQNFNDISITTNKLQQTFPNFDWMKFINKLLALHNVTIKANEKLYVSLKYLEGLETLLQTTSKRTLANYMIWRFIFYCTPFLNRALREARLKYFQVFTGISTFSMRWKYCLHTFIDKEYYIERESLLIATGALYVRKYISKKFKEYAQELISNINRSFQDTLEHTEWMDPETRKKALDKAKAMTMNTAYPDEFLDDKIFLQFYNDDIELEENYLKAILKLNQFDIRHHFRRLRESVDRKNWIEEGHVLMVNAFNKQEVNSINVPVGVLQNQVYSTRKPNYMNYGAIGTFIGHEITHGFDNQGRNYDQNGNTSDWWTPESRNSFENKSACIIKQYSKFMLPEINMMVDGTLTLGENIADNGGFVTSYKAYQKWVQKYGTEKRLPGLNYTQNQLFWISLANFYCSKRKPEFLQRLLLDTHSPNRFRVIGTLRNYNEFAKDFHCSDGSKMNPKQKCKLW